MRRSRISIKPSFKSGSRTATEGGEQATQTATLVDNTLKAEELEKPTQSDQQSATLKKPTEDVGLKETAEMPTKTNQNNGAPSSGAVTPSTAPHRRMRISAVPKLVRPKLCSAPRSQTSASLPSLVPSPLPNSPLLNEKHVPDSASEARSSVPVISNSLSNSGTPRKLTFTTEPSSTISQSTSPSVPSTSSLRKALVSGKNAVEDSPPSPQPGQVPQQPSQEPEFSECPSNLSLIDSKTSQSDKAGSSEISEKVSDKDKILRALKLKELMKIERRKDIKKWKKRVGHKDYTAVDRSKMTMRDLIYYLPNTSPMRSSVDCEENPEETIIPPSPRTQIKTAEKEEEEEEESDNEETLMPKVRVAEDGSIILDEESLTVRVQRTSNTKVVENFTLFERGSTTTYSSFRTQNCVKSWSVRETDLFFLAISMVGTDFSLIGQLLTHRSRAAIKSKFKKEEKINSWRVDKALRNNRPFDKEFFGYLLEKVLAKDKDKRKSIKLVIPKTRKPRRSKGKILNKASSDDLKENDENNIFHMVEEDDGVVNVDKESVALSNEKEANTPAKKRCKRTRNISNSKDKDEDGFSEKQVKRKRQRRTDKEVHSKEDGENGNDVTDESNSLNVNKEDEPEKNTSASKRGCKHSKDDAENQTKKPVQRRKGKQTEKSLEEPVSQHEESCIADGEGSATKKKRKRIKNMDLDDEEPVEGKRKTKRKKALKSTVKEGVMAEEEDSLADLQEAEQLNTPEVGNNVSPKASKQNKKALPKLSSKQSKKRKEPETSAGIDKESQDEENESILTAADNSLEDERLQMQAVVVLERTPPRQHYLLSPSNIRCKNNELSASSSSSDESSTQQSRTQRAGRVKRDLSTRKKAKRRKESIDQCVSPMVLLESITREDEDEDEDHSLNENLIDFSCLHGLDSHGFQRNPMVVLSREEVDMILNASEQSSEEDPSVSPLDLSLNTELSFPFQCSKLLEDNDVADVVGCMEENEKSANVEAYCEPKNIEELELMQSALAQTDVPSPGGNSTPLKLEVCSQPEVDLNNEKSSCSKRDAEPQVHPVAQEDVPVVAAVLDVPPPLVFLENVEPICMKREVPVTQEMVTSEAATLDILSVVSDLMEESKNAMLPSEPNKRTELDSSVVTETIKMSSVARELRSNEEVKAELLKSLKEPSQPLETMHDVSESKEDTHEPAMKGPEIKVQTESCAVAPEVTKDSQEVASVQSRPTRRSRILKPKPNLNQKSRATVPQNPGQQLKRDSTLKPKSIEPSPTEKPIASPANDLHGSFENVNYQNKEELTSPSNAMDRMEPETLKDLSEASTAVKDQENISTFALGPGSAARPQEASERCSDVDMIPPCTLPQSSQNIEDAGSGQTTAPSEDVCAPAEIVHLTDDGRKDEEPTFILTLYEIPVTETYLPSCSNDPVMISELPVVETQASLRFSDPAVSFPSRFVQPSIDPLQLQNDSDIVAKDSLKNGKKENLANAPHDITSPNTKDCDPYASLETGILTLQQHSVHLDLTEKCERVSHLLDDVFVPVSEEIGDNSCNDKLMTVACKLESIEDSTVSVTEDVLKNAKEQRCNYSGSHESVLLYPKDEEGEKGQGVPDYNPHNTIESEFAQLDDSSSSMNQSTSYGSNFSKCIALPPDSEGKDTEQCERVSHVLLDDLFVPVSGQMHDNSSWQGGTEDLAEIVKQQISEESTSHQPIILETKYEEGDVCVNLESGISLNLDPESKCKYGSEVVQPENLPFKDQNTQSGFNSSKCITLHQDSTDSNTEQSVGVSHMMLGDILVPVSDDLEDDLSKDEKMAVECKLESNEASTVGGTEDFTENFKEQISKEFTSPETFLLDTKDESNVTDLDPKNSSEFAPCKNVSPSRLNTSKRVPLHPDLEDTEQCDRVSHVLLDDVFVPVLEELGDDLSKTKVVESKENSSHPEGQDAPFEEIHKVENLPLISTKESKYTTALSEKTKSSPRRRDRQNVKPRPKLVKRACVKVDTTAEVVKSPPTNQPTSSRLNLPSSYEENTNIENSGKKMPSITTSVSKGKKEKLYFTADESPEMSKGPLETKPITTALHLSKELNQEESKNLMEDTIDKADMEASAEDKQLSVSKPNERTNVQTYCEVMHFNVLKSPGSGPSTVDSVKTRIEARGVSHMVFPDVFVLVSDVMKDNLGKDWIKSSPQRASLSERTGPHFQKELITEDVAQQCVEDLTVETKTPVRKRTKLDHQSPHTMSSSSSSTELPILPQRDSVQLVEETLQKKHNIVPCSVKLSSLDTVDQNLCASQLGDGTSIDKTAVISSPTRLTVSGESIRPSLLGKVKLEVEKKSPTRRKGKKSSPDKKLGDSKPVHTSLHTRQLTIPDWVKTRLCQTETNQKEKQPAKSPQKQSSPKVKDVHELIDKKTCSKPQHADSVELECSGLVPPLEESKDVNSASTEVKRLSEMVTELTEEGSIAQVKSPPKRRAKLQLKPTLAKRACTKGKTSTSDQEPATLFTSPTRHGVRAAREKKESTNENKQPVKNVSNTSRDEAHSKCKGSPPITSGPLSPKTQDVWPKVVLPRVNLDTAEAGICSSSFMPTSSPARVSHSTSLSVTPPKMKKSPTQSWSPAYNENQDDDPAKVSQFFFSDIFTQVEEAE